MWTETQTTLRETIPSPNSTLLSTREFFDWLCKHDWHKQGFDLLKVDFKPKDFFEYAAQSKTFSLVRSSGGYLSFVREEYPSCKGTSAQPLFDWHTDGSHHALPPHLVLLYCVNPGKSENPTLLTDTTHALNMLSPFMDTLSKLDTIPAGKPLELQPTPLIRKHPWKESHVITLPRRSIIFPRITAENDLPPVPDLRTTAKAIQNLTMH